MAARRSPQGSKQTVRCLADIGLGQLDQDEVHEAQLPGIVDELIQLQHEFESSGQFIEAELVRLRLEKLRQQEEARIAEEFESRHLAERLGVEEAHVQELREFEEIRDEKDAEFESHVAGLQRTLRDRHLQAQEAHRAKILNSFDGKQPRWSKDLLSLRKSLESLAKQKRYLEAAKMQQEVDQLEAKEEAEWRANLDLKLAQQQEQLLMKQQLEMSGLIARIESNRQEHKKAKKTELNRVLQRYQNVKKQLESQQKTQSRRSMQYGDFFSDTASVSSRYSFGRGNRSAAFNGGQPKAIMNSSRHASTISTATASSGTVAGSMRLTSSSAGRLSTCADSSANGVGSKAFAPPARSAASSNGSGTRAGAKAGARPPVWR